MEKQQKKNADSWCVHLAVRTDVILAYMPVRKHLKKAEFLMNFFICHLLLETWAPLHELPSRPIPFHQMCISQFFFYNLERVIYMLLRHNSQLSLTPFCFWHRDMQTLVSEQFKSRGRLFLKYVAITYPPKFFSEVQLWGKILVKYWVKSCLISSSCCPVNT